MTDSQARYIAHIALNVLRDGKKNANPMFEGEGKNKGKHMAKGAKCALGIAEDTMLDTFAQAFGIPRHSVEAYIRASVASAT